MSNTRSARNRWAVLVIVAALMCSGGCSADDFALTTLADVLAALVVTGVTLIMDQGFAVFAV